MMMMMIESLNPFTFFQAYHFFLLAQRQMYEGAIDAAMKTVRFTFEKLFRHTLATIETKSLNVVIKS